MHFYPPQKESKGRWECWIQRFFIDTLMWCSIDWDLASKGCLPIEKNNVFFLFFFLLIHVVIQQNHLWDFNSDTEQTLPMFHGTLAHILFLLSKNGKHGENRVQIEDIVSLDKEMWLYSPYVFLWGSRINQRRGNGGAQYFAVRSAETSTTLLSLQEKTRGPASQPPSDQTPLRRSKSPPL